MRPEVVGAHLLIRGRVQGVGFRYFAQEEGTQLRLCGWVRNLPDQTVECYAEGPRSAIETFIAQLEKGPPLSRVESIAVDWRPSEYKYNTFSIQ